MGAVRGDAVPPTYRSRLLLFNENGLIVERPTQADAAVHLAVGSRARLLAVQGDQRWEVWSTVTHYSSFSLNGTMKVTAIHLTPPADARTGQRRGYFRASAVSAKLDPILMTPIAPEGTDPAANVGESATPQQRALAAAFQPFKARLVNIGGGGVGIEAPQKAAPLVKAIKHYTCRLVLPTLDEPVDVVARTVHLAPLEGGTHYMGMAFEFADRLQKQLLTARIQRFTADLERQQLQRTGRRTNER